LEGLEEENVGIFYDHLEYFTAIWYIFPILVCLDQEKCGNPGQKQPNEKIDENCEKRRRKADNALFQFPIYCNSTSFP
jgi:hypothetical protein